MRKLTRRALGLAVAGLTAVSVVAIPPAATSATGAPPTFVMADCVHAKHRPARIIIACGDGNFALTQIQYNGWGARQAAGTDRTFQNSCNPNCASGHAIYHHDKFILDRVRSFSGRMFFTRAHVYRNGRLLGSYPLATPTR